MYLNNLLKSILLSLFFLLPFQMVYAQTQIGSDINGEAEGDRSGWSIELSSDGNRVAIGATYNAGNGIRSGHVRIYELENGEWTQLGADIDGEIEFDQSGNAVALSDDGGRVAIGSEFNDGSNGESSGHVRIYKWNGSNWTQLGSDIDGEAEGDRSGISVALSPDGNRVVIGAFSNDGDNGESSGHIRIYEWDGSDWLQLGDDIDGEAAGDSFGRSVDISSNGERILAGADSNDENGQNAGHVRIYDWDGSDWIQLGSDIDGTAAGDRFGWSSVISSDGNRVAVGAIFHGGGHVQVHEWDGTSWTQMGSAIEAEGTGDLFGYSVDLSSNGNRVVIGAVIGEGAVNIFSGYARIYDFVDGAWEQQGTDIDGEENQDWFGYSVSLSDDGERAAVSSIFHDTNSGHTKIYDLDAPLPVELIYFRGQVTNSGNLLTWATASEFDNSHFVIEHSIDGINFYPIGEVLGNDISVIRKDFEFLHGKPVGKNHYYRLKQIDYSGSFEYSDIINISTQFNQIEIYPNPSKGTFEIIGLEGNGVIQVFDLLGREINNIQINGNRIDLSNLSNGVYYITLVNNGQLVVRKVLKE